MHSGAPGRIEDTHEFSAHVNASVSARNVVKPDQDSDVRE